MQLQASCERRASDDGAAAAVTAAQAAVDAAQAAHAVPPTSDGLLEVVRFLRREKEIAETRAEVAAAESARLRLGREALEQRATQAEGALATEREAAQVRDRGRGRWPQRERRLRYGTGGGGAGHRERRLRY